MNDKSLRVLVVDDEEDIRDGCERILTRVGYFVEKSTCGDEALSLLESNGIDIVLLDLKMPGLDGMDVLRYIGSRDDDTIVIVITGYATVETAVEALRQGAYDFISKPFQTDQLRFVVGRAREKLELKRKAERLDRQRRKNLLDLDTEKSRIRTIIESLPDGVVVTNRDGKVVLMNQPFLDCACIDPSRSAGGDFKEYIDNDELTGIVAEVSGCPSSEDKVVTCEMNFCGDRHILAEARPVIESDGECIGAVVTFIDITELKILDDLKTDYIERVTHELRSPLATIHEQLSVVMDDLDDGGGSREKHLLSRAMKRTSGLISLVGDLLDLSKIADGSFARELKLVDLGELLSDIVEFLRAKGDTHNQSVSVQVPEKGLPEVCADSFMLESIFGNLISNAIKYTPDGGRIEVSARERNGTVEVKVSDNGIGIDEEDLNKIFERFYRVKNNYTRNIIGTGLGLPIVQALVDVLDGEVRVESQLGNGTTFTVLLPGSGNASE